MASAVAVGRARNAVAVGRASCTPSAIVPPGGGCSWAPGWCWFPTATRSKCEQPHDCEQGYCQESRHCNSSLVYLALRPSTGTQRFGQSANPLPPHLLANCPRIISYKCELTSDYRQVFSYISLKFMRNWRIPSGIACVIRNPSSHCRRLKAESGRLTGKGLSGGARLGPCSRVRGFFLVWKGGFLSRLLVFPGRCRRRFISGCRGFDRGWGIGGYSLAGSLTRSPSCGN